MIKVLITDKLAQEGIDLLNSIEGVEAVVKTGISEEELAKIIAPGAAAPPSMRRAAAFFRFSVRRPAEPPVLARNSPTHVTAILRRNRSNKSLV